MSDSKSTEELSEEVEGILMHFAELAVVGEPEKELLRAKVMVLELFDQELERRVEGAKLQEWITAPLQPHSHHANGTRMCVPVNYRNARIRELRGQTLNTQTKENE